MGAKHWNRSLEPEQTKGPTSNFIKYTEIMGSIPPAKAGSLEQVAQVGVQTGHGYPQRRPPEAPSLPRCLQPHAAAPDLRVCSAFATPRVKKPPQNLCLSPSPEADPLLLAACGCGSEQGTSSLWRPRRRLPAPRPPAEPAGPLEKNPVKYFYLFFSLLFIIPSWKMNFYFPNPLCPFPPADFLINVSFGSCLCIPWFELR